MPQAWQARNERARALGYESYYDYRVHDYGRQPPTQPRPSGEQLARLRGHRGSADLQREIRAGRVADVDPRMTRRDPKTGRITEVTMIVTYQDGSQRRFRLHGKQLQPARARRIRDTLVDAGVNFRHAYVLSAAWAKAA